MIVIWGGMGAKRRSRRERGGELAALAARQHGVVSIRQLEGTLGYSRRAVARRLEVGAFHRLHRGVYAVGHAKLTHHGRALAAVLACGPDALLSHRSGGWLWGIWRGSPSPIEVTTPIPRRRKRSIVVHYARGLEPDDRELVEGIPVTAVPRTLLDLAARIHSRWLGRCLERAEELALLDLGQVEALLRRTAGHPGHGRLRRALALYETPRFTRSGLERRLLDGLRKAGLPAPATGYNVLGFELDLYWPESRLAVEVDTFETHGTHAAFERDRERDSELRAAEVEVERVTGLRIERELDQVIRQIAGLLARRRRGAVAASPSAERLRPGGPPSGA